MKGEQRGRKWNRIERKLENNTRKNIRKAIEFNLQERHFHFFSQYYEIYYKYMSIFLYFSIRMIIFTGAI